MESKPAGWIQSNEAGPELPPGFDENVDPELQDTTNPKTAFVEDKD